jgi:hypothetical protein
MLLFCERSAIPLVLSWMIIYLTADQSRGPEGLRPTRPEGPTWTCTVAEIARDIRLSPAGLRFSSSLQVQAPTRVRFPHRRLAPPGLTSCAIFLLVTRPQAPKRARTSPVAVPGSSSPGHSGVSDRKASPVTQRDHLPNSHVRRGRLWHEYILPRSQIAHNSNCLVVLEIGTIS